MMGVFDSIDLSNFGGFDVSTFVLIMTAWLFVLLFFIVIVAAVLFWFVYLNKKAIIIEDLGIQKWKNTRGRIRKDVDGIERLRLFKSAIDILPPPQEYYIVSGVRTPLIVLLKQGDSFIPVKPIIYAKPIIRNGKKIEASVLFKAESQKRLIWLNERKRQTNKFDPKGFWDKYGTAITIMGTLLICLLILVVTFKYQADTSASANLAAEKIGDAMERFARALKDSNALG